MVAKPFPWGSCELASCGVRKVIVISGWMCYWFSWFDVDPMREVPASNFEETTIAKSINPLLP